MSLLIVQTSKWSNSCFLIVQIFRAHHLLGGATLVIEVGIHASFEYKRVKVEPGVVNVLPHYTAKQFSLHYLDKEAGDFEEEVQYLPLPPYAPWTSLLKILRHFELDREYWRGGERIRMTAKKSGLK